MNSCLIILSIPGAQKVLEKVFYGEIGGDVACWDSTDSNTGIIYFIINNITIFLHITGFVPKNCGNFVTAHNLIKNFGATGT